MVDPRKAEELFAHGAGKALEGMTVWADANQRVLQQLAELSAATARETVRLYADLQQTALEALRESQAASLRWQASWHERPQDAFAWYQRALTGSVDGAQKAFRLIEGNAGAVTRSAERLQTTAEQAGKGIQETFSSAVAKLKEVYAA